MSDGRCSPSVSEIYVVEGKADSMSRRIMTTENLEEDVRIENHLRPQLLEDYIGSGKSKRNG